MKKTTQKHFELPAHRHIELGQEGITYNSDRGLKYRPFADFRKEMSNLVKPTPQKESSKVSKSTGKETNQTRKDTSN